MGPAIGSVDMIGQLQSLMRALEAGTYDVGPRTCWCQEIRPDDWESHTLFCTGPREQMQGLSQQVESLENMLSQASSK
jgi:hypothetical protein